MCPSPRSRSEGKRSCSSVRWAWWAALICNVWSGGDLKPHISSAQTQFQQIQHGSFLQLNSTCNCRRSEYLIGFCAGRVMRRWRRHQQRVYTWECFLISLSTWWVPVYCLLWSFSIPKAHFCYYNHTLTSFFLFILLDCTLEAPAGCSSHLQS